MGFFIFCKVSHEKRPNGHYQDDGGETHISDPLALLVDAPHISNAVAIARRVLGKKQLDQIDGFGLNGRISHAQLN